jgi:hypothetical protein
MVNKKGMTDIWKIVLFIILILIVMGIAYSFSSNNNDPDNLVPDNLLPDDLSITGNAILAQDPLTTQELTAGVRLDRRSNIIIWTIGLNENLAPAVAFSSILPNLGYLYDYNRKLYYFNPNGNYNSFNSNPDYNQELTTEIVPGNAYYLYLENDDILVYPDNDPADLVTIHIREEVIPINPGDIATIFNGSIHLQTLNEALNGAINSDNQITIEGATCGDADVAFKFGQITFGDVALFADCFGKTEEDARCTTANFGRFDFDNDGHIGMLDLTFLGNCFATSGCSIPAFDTKETCEAEPGGVWRW